MPQQSKYTFECEVCGETYTSKNRSKAERKARECEESHDIVYIPLLKSDLMRLISFITSKDDDYLTKSLVETLFKYKRLGGQGGDFIGD